MRMDWDCQRELLISQQSSPLTLGRLARVDFVLLLKDLVKLVSKFNFGIYLVSHSKPNSSLLAINCRDNGDGTCFVAYLPTDVGDYSVNITFDDQHIPNSPFQAIIVPEPNLKKTKVSGVGIQPHGNNRKSHVFLKVFF